MNLFTRLSFCLVILLTLAAFSPSENPAGEKVKWYSWEEAVAANKENPKKMMIDIYTGWCHWCKVMDKQTFNEPEIAKYLNENFYPVKLDAEQKEDIVFGEHTFKYQKSGRRGVHSLAYSLLDGSLSYPSIVFMDQDVKRIMISKGFKKPDAFQQELDFVAGEHYKDKSFDQFKTEK